MGKRERFDDAVECLAPIDSRRLDSCFAEMVSATPRREEYGYSGERDPEKKGTYQRGPSV